MSDIGEALAAVGALIIGGYLFLQMSATLGTELWIDASFWGIALIVVGIVGGVAVIGAVIGTLFSW